MNVALGAKKSVRSPQPIDSVSVKYSINRYNCQIVC